MISVVVPTYNRASLLNKTLQSIISQTYKNIEIIVVDDGSTDNTMSMIQEFSDKRVKYYKMDRTADIAKLRNIGVSHTVGEYIGFCDDDDLWLKDKLEIQFKYMDGFDFVCSNANIIDSESQVIKDKYFSNFNENRIFDVMELLEWNKIITSSVLIRKNIMKYKFNEKNSTCSAEDYELWLKLSEDNKIYYLDKPLVSFRLHANTSTFNSEKDILLQDSVLSIIKPYFKYKDENIANLSKRIYTVKIIQLSKLSLTKGYFKFFNDHFLELLFILLNPKTYYIVLSQKMKVFKFNCL